MSVRRIVDAPLRNRNTFGVAANAGMLIEIDDCDDLPALFSDELSASPPLVLGGGSNLLLVGDPKCVLSLSARRVALVGIYADHAIARADAGADWHDFVMWALERGWCGLENLALIPGTIGAAPIQNIGAYGMEVAERIHAVEAFERATGTFHRLDAAACRFAYRDSVFKHEPERWLITAVEFVLSRTPDLKLDYVGIREELVAMEIETPSAHQVAQAVIRLRQRKLPSPAVIGNAGSFFKNPIVPADQAEALKREHDALPVFPSGDTTTRKLSAAWLIDACGWKGQRLQSGSGDAGVSDKHALVLVNHGHATGAELLTLAREIAASVQMRFGLSIEPEPRIVGAAW